jgi:hypothetical protein
MATAMRVPVEVYLRFSYVPKGIAFPMDRIKEYLD